MLNLTLEEDREMQIADSATNSKIVNSKEIEYPQGNTPEQVNLMITEPQLPHGMACCTIKHINKALHSIYCFSRFV